MLAKRKPKQAFFWSCEVHLWHVNPHRGLRCLRRPFWTLKDVEARRRRTPSSLSALWSCRRIRFWSKSYTWHLSWSRAADMIYQWMWKRRRRCRRARLWKGNSWWENVMVCLMTALGKSWEKDATKVGVQTEKGRQINCCLFCFYLLLL